MVGSGVLDLAFSVIFILGSMFFSFSELAIFTVDKIKLYKLVRKVKEGKYLKKLLKNHRETLVVVLFMNLFFNVGFSIFAQRLVDNWKITASAILSSILITFVLTLFGEVLPKVGLFSLAEVSVIAISRIVYFISVSLKPIVFLANKIIISPLFGVLGSYRKSTRSYAVKLPEMLKRNLKGSKLRRIANIVVADVRELMVPYSDFFVVPLHLSGTSIIRKIKDFRLKGNYAVVYQDSRNNVVGCVPINKLLYAIYRKEKLLDHIEPVMFVAETKRCYELLREMKSKGINVAVVIDEYGNIIGVIEKSTILIEMFSGIEVEKVEGGYLLKGDTTIDEFNEYFGLSEDSKSYHTISGLIIEKMGRIPVVGEEIEFDDFIMKVVDVKQGKIEKIVVKKKG